MLWRKELYFLILSFFLGQSYGQEFYESFKAELSSGKKTTVCDFEIHFTDKKILLGKSKVKKCSKLKKLMTVEHVHETKSMHILTLKLQIFKNGNGNGNGKIKEGSTVETSKIFYNQCKINIYIH